MIEFIFKWIISITLLLITFHILKVNDLYPEIKITHKIPQGYSECIKLRINER